jgi:hypothetical protein
LGEPGNDAEGYSGYDGRTTIFDYWSIPTVRRWFNAGACNAKLLTDKEQRLRNCYRTILNICIHEKAVIYGQFFDLMYVNYDNPTLNPHRQYAFMRSYAGETLIIAVNFASTPCDLRINIPQHAFDVLNIQETDCMATNLLTNEIMSKSLSANEPFETAIGASDAVVWKIKHKNISRNDKKLRQ